jgi:hypothetical protein
MTEKTDEAPQLIAFDAMQSQLAAAVEAVPPAQRIGAPPVATYQKGTLDIVIERDGLPRDAFFVVLDVLGKYMKTIADFKPGVSGCTITADPFSTYDRKPPRTGSATTALPAPFKIAFYMPDSGRGKVTFSKDSLLMQEELNCVLDVWRAIAVDPTQPGDAVSSELGTVIAYDAMVAHIASVTETELARVGAASRNGGPPVIALRKNTVAIEMKLATLTRESFFPALEIASKYVRTYGDFSSGLLGTSLTADLESRYRKRGKAGLLRLAFGFDTSGSGKLTIEKDALLIQEEINFVLDLWRKLAIRSAADGGASRDPRAALTELGAVVFDPDPSYTADRIAGYDATKRDIHETVVLPLLHVDVFVEIAKLTRGQPRPSVPRAVLFEGPPGTGKTTMARVIATQAGVPMIYVPVESIMSKWFGESERRLDAIFDLAGALPRSIVFLDEIDAFAGSRAGQIHEATRRILSVLLRQMQGLVETSNVMVVGATNRAADLDAALLNRFARTIRFPLPDQKEREAIIRRYARHLDDASLAQVAAAADGASGRTLEDGCGSAERLWAGRVIAAGEKPSAPPLAAYLEAFTKLGE